MGEEGEQNDMPESLEELSGEWMRQQLQEAAVNTAPPPPEPPKKPESAPTPWPAPPAAAVPPPEHRAAAAPPPAGPGPDEVLAGLAQSVSQAVVSAVSQLEQRRVSESRSLELAVRDQEERLQGAVERVAEMHRRFDRLAQIIEEQKSLAHGASENYGRLATELAEIRKLEAGRESILEDLRRESLDLSVSVSDRQDQLTGRIDLQQTDIADLKSELAQLKPRLEAADDRLSRHSAAIRAIYQAERRREAALEQLTEAASSLKSASLHLPEGLAEELL